MSACVRTYSDESNRKHFESTCTTGMTSQIDEICQEFEKYGTGIRQSLALFVELRKIKDFDRFLKKLQREASTEGVAKLSVCLQRPVEHLKTLTLLSQKICKLTQPDSPDFENLQELVRALRRCSGNITSQFISQSELNLTTVTSASQTTLQRLDQSQHSICSDGSVDSEVKDIQNRLVFEDDSKQFQLTNSSARHVIYSGHLLLKQQQKFVQVRINMFE